MKPEEAVRRYQSGMLPFAVDVYLDTYHGPSWVKQQLRGRSGWLQVSRASLSTQISDWTATITVAVTDDGRRLGTVSSAAFLAMRSSNPQTCFDDPPEELEGMTDMLFWDFLGGRDLRHLDMLAEAEVEITSRVETEQARGETVLAEVENYIANLRRQRRDPGCTGERRAELESKIALMDEKHTAAAAWLVRRLASIRQEGVAFEADVMEALENHGEIEELYTARWVARSLHDRFVDRALMTDLTRTASLAGVPLERRLNAEDRWEIEAARKPKAIFAVAQPPKQRLNRDEGVQPKLRIFPGAIEPSNVENGPNVRQQEKRVRASHDSRPGKMVVSEKPAPPVRSSEMLRVEENARWLREKAEQKQAKMAAAKLAREREVQALIDLYGSAEALDKRLADVPSMGSENRRLSRLIRDAIARLTSTKVGPEPSTDDVAFPVDALMPTSPLQSAAPIADDSIDIGALIERDLAELLKDLQ